MTHRLLDVDGHAVTVSDPEHRLGGDTGPTKLEIMAYYVKVAPRLLPFLCGRATTMVFGPDESTQVFRFARTAPPGCAGRFPTYRLTCFAKPQPESYLTVPDGGTLEALVDYGYVSFHPWSSLAGTALQASQMVFNLDPEAIAFREVRNAALLLRDLLIACGLTAWAKTSGGQGLHVLVPLDGRGSFDDTHLVADTIVRRAIRREPMLFSRDPRRARRRGRILIDTSRNACGGTLIAPYSVATSGLVSAPVEWDELQRPMYPEDFDMARVMARESVALEDEAAFGTVEQSIEPLLGLSADGSAPRRKSRASRARTCGSARGRSSRNDGTLRNARVLSSPHAGQGPVAAVCCAAGRASGALRQVRTGGPHSLDASPRQPHQGAAADLGLHRVSTAGGAPGAGVAAGVVAEPGPAAVATPGDHGARDRQRPMEGQTSGLLLSLPVTGAAATPAK